MELPTAQNLNDSHTSEFQTEKKREIFFLPL